MIGHGLVIRAFRKLVSEGNLAHSYVFFGPEGVGKRLLALGLANFLETDNFEWDDKKPPVLGDLLAINPGVNSIGIESVRQVRHFLAQRPNRSAYRTVVVDRSELMSTEAQNAFLKIAEEPPRSALIVFVTQNPENLVPTLISRLQKVHFAALPSREVKEWLIKEGCVLAEKAEELAKSSFGQPGLALRMWQDDELKKNLRLAQEFLKLKRLELSSKDFLKDLLESEVKVEIFLDALIIELARDSRINYNLWHSIVDLRRNFSYFPLNPRLQLQSLLNQKN